MFIVNWTQKALDELNKLENLTAHRILKKVDELIENPYEQDIKKLKDSGNFRLRVGDYRIIFNIEKENIFILKVGHRKNIYDR
ncbi:MAG: type II toxin-antitoxin system RelE/ParE family toxin [Candidatus Nanoarchaeia archaeon]|nr:type II toxin-antitoxin system RelE/ParE family toxin [Candidatus Nanoarchaeia archaeon]MDD5588225.1 type II toxin-antitoxin system RelE/ParE family toxin [Candidatus Nanoarchaeia archaeon]